MARRAKGDGTLYKSTDGLWRGYITLPDGRRAKFSSKSRALAEQKRKQLIQQRDTIGVIARDRFTVGEWLTHWIDATAERHKPSTTQGYRYAAGHYLSDSFLNLQLNRVTIERVEAEYELMASKGLAGSTRHQVHSILSGAFRSAIRRGHLPINPASMAENKPKIERKPVESLSFAQVTQIEQALESDPQKARWMLALGLGLRPGEVRGLEWHQLDWESKTLRVGQQVQMIAGELMIIDDAKSSAGDRVIPVPDYLLEILRAHRIDQLTRLGDREMWSPDGSPRSWIFTQRNRPGVPITHDSDKTNWANILRRAGLDHVKPYVTRHTAASVLIAHGVDAVTVAEILGHTDANFTIKTYVHSIDERKRLAAQVLDSARSAGP